MKTIAFFGRTCSRFLCLMICVPVYSEAASTELVAYKPSWEIGRTWYVEVDTQTEPPRKSRREEFVSSKVTYGYVFKVEAQKNVEGELCYQVRIDLATRDGNNVEASPGEHKDFYRIFNRVDDYSLKLIQRLGVNNGVLQASKSYARRPVHATNWTNFLPLDFPLFSEEAQKYAPDASGGSPEDAERRVIESQQKPQAAEGVWEVNGTKKPAVNVTLLREHPGSEAGAEVSEQIWVKGMPWPVRVVYKYGKRPPLYGKLVRVDGSSIVATLRAEKQEK